MSTTGNCAMGRIERSLSRDSRSSSGISIACRSASGSMTGSMKVWRSTILFKVRSDGLAKEAAFGSGE
ncbi:hypothetical protein [Azospirillum palustre]